jgi:AmpE protein
MALRLFAVLIVLAALWLAPQYARYRRWQWFEGWLRRLDGSAGMSWVLLAVVAPALLAALVALLLHGALFGLLSLLFSVLVLGLCLNELEPDIDAVLKAPDRAARETSARALYVDAATELPLDPANLVEATVMAALRRRFGVIFWFSLLGPGGALLFRLGHRAVQATAAGNDTDARRIAGKLAAALDWLPAHLMALGMALASNFDAVAQAWRAWHADPARAAWEFEPGFLAAISRASVEADSDDDLEAGVDAALKPLADTRLLLRVLVLWLAAAALIVLAGWVA